MKKRRENKEASNDRWLLTYSDLITLLMIFFVIMYASSNADTTKYKQLSQSLNAAFNGSNGKSIIGDGSGVSVLDSSGSVPAKQSVDTKASEYANEIGRAHV